MPLLALFTPAPASAQMAEKFFVRCNQKQPACVLGNVLPSPSEGRVIEAPDPPSLAHSNVLDLPAPPLVGRSFSF